MKHILLILCVVVSVLLCSCELAYEKHDPAPEVGTVRILVYGNDYTYQPTVQLGSRNPGIAPHLEGTVNDAVQIGLALTSLARKAGIPYQCTYVIGCSDMTDVRDAILAFDPYATVVLDCTKDRLIQELSSLKVSAHANDMTFVFFAGHGYGNGDQMDYGTNVADTTYLVLNDTDPHKSVLMPISGFLESVDAIPGIKVVFGDFCYSGSLVRPGNVSVGDGEYRAIGAAKLFGYRKDGIGESSSTFCLSAARYYEKSYESSSDYRHGYFTNAILKCLDWNEEDSALGNVKVLDSKGRLTLLNLANYVILNDGKASQTPMVSGGSNDIVLFSL